MLSAYFQLWWVHWRLRRRHDGWLNQQLLTARPLQHEHVVIDDALVGGIHRSVQRATRWQWLDTRCLPRALVLKQMLQRRQIPATVVLGVRRDKAYLASHAWVEVMGRKIGEPESVKEQFTPVSSHQNSNNVASPRTEK